MQETQVGLDAKAWLELFVPLFFSVLVSISALLFALKKKLPLKMVRGHYLLLFLSAVPMLTLRFGYCLHFDGRIPRCYANFWGELLRGAEMEWLLFADLIGFPLVFLLSALLQLYLGTRLYRAAGAKSLVAKAVAALRAYLPVISLVAGLFWVTRLVPFMLVWAVCLFIGKLKKNAAPIAIFVTLVSLGAAHAEPPQRILRVRNLGDPITFDWNRAFTPVEATLVRNLQEGLVSAGAKLNILPATAEKWDISPDGKTYTFHLRKKVLWSDGVELTAQHYVDSWQRLLTPSFKANYAYLLLDVAGAEDFHTGKNPDFSAVGVRAIDARTLQVTLRAPIAYWIWIPTFWATFPIRKDLIEKLGAEWDRPGKLVSLGPFLLESYESKRQVTLKRNPTYYGKRGNVEKVHSALVDDDSSSVQIYDSDQIDFMTKVSSVDIKRLKGREDFRRWPEARVVHLDFNPNAGPMKNVKLRRAIAMAIDRVKLSKVVEGAYQSADSFIPPGIMGYEKGAGLSYDPARARALLETIPIEERSQRLDFVTVGFTDESLVAKSMVDDLKATLGLNIELHVYEPRNFYSPAVNFSGFSMLLTRWTGDYPDPDNFLSIFLSTAGNNRVGWKSEEFDVLVKGARTIQHKQMRLQAYAKAQKMLLEDEVIAVPIYYGQNAALVCQKITGFQPSLLNSYLFKDFSIR